MKGSTRSRTVSAGTGPEERARDQLAALTQILEAIDAPAGAQSLERILQVVVDSAARLCGADSGSIIAVENGQLQELAFTRTQFSDEPAYRAARRANPLPVDRTTVTGRVLLEGRSVRIEDTQSEPGYVLRPHPGLAGNDARQNRSVLGVPLRLQAEILGVLVLRRVAVAPFSDEDLATVETFARPAAIAIQNARLFNETKEALERQTATSDVLQVISRSPTELSPVFDEILGKAARFAEASIAALFLFDGAVLTCGGSYNVTPEFAEHLRRLSVTPSTETPTRRAALERRVIHVQDVHADPDYVPSQAHGWEAPRTVLSVPMLREDRLIGVITVWRREVRAFSDRQIQLVRTFADQAVIAIENVRLFNETKESLEQQTAIAEILASISGSPTEITPVLGSISRNAAQLCRAQYAGVMLLEKSLLVAHQARPDGSVVRGQPFDPEGSVSGRAMRELRTVQVLDILATDEYPVTKASRLAATLQDAQTRTVMATPLVHQGEAVGTIFLRRTEVRAFSQREVVLVETFAQQAVLAIENVRLFNETKESLERQTATAEILRLIAASPTDVQPVLDGIARSAATFCSAEDASIGLLDGDGSQWSIRAHYGEVELVHSSLHPDPAGRRPVTISDEFVSGHAVAERRTINVPDLQSEEGRARYPEGAVAGPTTRAILATPLLRKGEPIGAIFLRRTEPVPFTERQIELVEAFASQAVIAIENVRLFNETKEALERQTATAEILRVISSSPTNVQPVLDAIAENARRFCAAEDASVVLRRDGTLSVAAHDGPLLSGAGGWSLDRSSVAGRSILEKRTLHVEDVLAEPDGEYDVSKRFAEFDRQRTILATPLLREQESIGAIFLRRAEVRPFTEQQVELVETFAAQAVIAIENVRLFNETKEALDQQAATARVLQVISRSAFDLRSALETLVEEASRLCAADHGSIHRWDGTAYRTAAFWGPGLSEEYKREGFESPRYPGRDTLVGRTALERDVVHIVDATTDPEYKVQSLQKLGGYRTMLGVPLMRDGFPIGVFALMRGEVSPFTERQVELVRTFADQAAIAIENVRLFNDIQDKSKQLEVASRHKSEFLANMSHELRTPLNAIIGFTDVMLEQMFGPLNDKQKEYLEDVRNSGTHLLTLINDILDLSKVEAGRIELEIGEFSFPDALDNALTLVRERATRHGISLAADVAGDVGTITADERKVKQVLVNLLANAVKFTPDGGRVTVKARRANGEIEVAVHDTGIGVATDDQDRIFDEFQQVGRDPDRSREGTGLGLTLAKRFVELHGGRIWVESEVGKGSTFTFAIPVRQTALADAKG